MKNALKFLFVRSIRIHPVRWIITTVLALAMLAAEFIWMVPQGEEDFLVSKMTFTYIVQIIHIVIMIFINAETAGNRSIRAFPFAKALYTRALPVFSAIISYGTAAVFLLLYAAGVLIMGESPVQISEMITVMIPMAFAYSLICAIAPIFRYGMLIMFYIPMWLIFAFVIFLPKNENILRSGIGLPMWAAVLIFICAAVVSVVISCIANGIIYKKASFRAGVVNNMAVK